MYEIQPSAADIDLFTSIPFLNSFLNSPALLNDLKAELPDYLAAAEAVSAQVDPLQWWKSHESQLLKWAKACSLVLLMQPSSTDAERVFSILFNYFSSQQESSLEDYIQLSIMFQYNKHV